MPVAHPDIVAQHFFQWPAIRGTIKAQQEKGDGRNHRQVKGQLPQRLHGQQIERDGNNPGCRNTQQLPLGKAKGNFILDLGQIPGDGNVWHGKKSLLYCALKMDLAIDFERNNIITSTPPINSSSKISPVTFPRVGLPVIFSSASCIRMT